MSSERVTIPPELSEIVRECAGGLSRQAFSRNMQVESEGVCCAELCIQLTPPGVTADCRGKARAGGGVLLESMRIENGPARALSAEKQKPNSPKSHCFLRESGITWYVPLVSGPVLAFDIETTGLTERDAVTCVCAYDTLRGIDFRRCTPNGEVCEDFLRLLDEAPLLCAFNGVRFDVPFLAKRWSVPAERAGAWVCKLVDPYEACKLALGQTFSLDKLLEANRMECKTGTGLAAVEMARDGRWGDLEAYCMSDTVKTHSLVTLGRLRLPASREAKKSSL